VVFCTTQCSSGGSGSLVIRRLNATTSTTSGAAGTQSTTASTTITATASATVVPTPTPITASSPTPEPTAASQDTTSGLHASGGRQTTVTPSRQDQVVTNHPQTPAGSPVTALVVRARSARLDVGSQQVLTISWLPRSTIIVTVTRPDGHVTSLHARTDTAGHARLTYMVPVYDPAAAARRARAAHKKAGQLSLTIVVVAQNGRTQARATGAYPLAPQGLTVVPRLKTLTVGVTQTLAVTYFAKATVRTTLLAADGRTYRLVGHTDGAGHATIRFTVPVYNLGLAARLVAATKAHGPAAVPALRVTVQAVQGANKANQSLTFALGSPSKVPGKH
jgi:hypothetical protein